ncbi:SDR family oxidoreductase [Thalassomonas viridans]|uniref:SDR family oxidoreductase n=1 Tax=Thalassomonas viridans TaxID=137584 RepID=A0AAF0CBV2_9GAMM|nr:SDR family oxidoreductase [Thalassomonas viridans]WDE07425.1 SDR family oxidoreductase [Thalassomonas viridans]
MGFSISNKVALVTGANRGIGKAIVESFLKHGAKKVYLAVRSLESTRELEQEYGDKVVSLQLDVSDNASIEQAAARAGDVDVVVNNAGVLMPSNSLSEHAEEALAKELDVNVFGLIRVAKAFAGILEQNRGALVQLNSVASIKNFAELSTYSASKAAAYSITQGIREQLAPKGISVLSVHPGPIATDMAAQAGFEGKAESTASVSEGIVQALAAGDFHLFPDTVSKEFEAAYQGYAGALIPESLTA